MNKMKSRNSRKGLVALSALLIAALVIPQAAIAAQPETALGISGGGGIR
jgi:hypothetical protein